jgi:hypothetical protein
MIVTTTRKESAHMAKKRDPREMLREEARSILREQRRILARAGAATREASQDFGRYAQDEVFPRFVSGSRRGVSQARHALVDDVLPAVGAAVGAAMNLLDGKAPKNARAALSAARSVVSRATKGGPKTSPAVGAYVGVAIGIAALVGIGYIAYQTFRADDELWVEEDDDL